MRFGLLIFPAMLTALAAPAMGAQQDARQGTSVTVASAEPAQQHTDADHQDGSARAATGAPRRISPLGGNDEEAWSHVGEPLKFTHRHD